jgi:hypothetical protein
MYVYFRAEIYEFFACVFYIVHAAIHVGFNLMLQIGLVWCECVRTHAYTCVRQSVNSHRGVWVLCFPSLASIRGCRLRFIAPDLLLFSLVHS